MTRRDINASYKLSWKAVVGRFFPALGLAFIPLVLLAQAEVTSQDAGQQRADGSVSSVDLDSVASERVLRDGSPNLADCADGTACRGVGHQSLKQAQFPWTEDIAALPTDAPCTGNIKTIPGYDCGGTSCTGGFCTVAYKCTTLPGNVNGASTFNASLRGWLEIKGSTAVAGTEYDVKLLLDGSPVAWYIRRLEGTYPYGQHFETTVHNVPAGPHTFSMTVSLVNAPGKTMDIGVTWLTASGAPSAYPSNQVGSTSSVNLTQAWTQIATTSFTSTADLDMSLQGYFQLNQAQVGNVIELGFSLDCQDYQRTSRVGLRRASLPTGYNVLDFLYNVPAGAHTLSLWARVLSPATSANITTRLLEYASYPTTYRYNTRWPFGASATNTVVVSTQSTDPQPSGTLINPTGGLWTKLLEFKVPWVPSQQGFSWMGEGYVEFLGTGTRVDPGLGVLAVEYLLPECFTAGPTEGDCTNCPGTCLEADNGFTSILIPTVPDGIHFFTDQILGSLGPATVRLWIRKNDPTCTQEPCTFNVGARYLSYRLVPLDNCEYK
jgi:hypothetical protein